MIKSLICLAGGHRIDRHRVWHDRQNYRSRCQACGQPLIRERGSWRRFNLASDLNEQRRPHPYTGKPA